MASEMASATRSTNGVSMAGDHDLFERGGAAILFTVTLEDDEYRALRWIADRYVCADLLDGWTAHPFDGDDDYALLTLTREDCATYAQALVDENGNMSQRVPPCAGGPLASKLATLRDMIDDECAPELMVPVDA